VITAIFEKRTQF